MPIGRLLKVLIPAIALFALAGPAWSQGGRTVKVIVPSTPGGGSDVLARLLADQIGRANGQTMIVENRPGASNTIGTEAASRAAPDGNTLVVTTPEFVITSHTRKLSYDPLTSFEPICYVVRSPQLLVVNTDSPYRTLADLLEAARKKPGELNLASAGPASSPHIAIETLKRAAKVDILYVPYPGSGPAVNALMGGHITGVLAALPNVAEQVRSGKLRALAATSKTRIEDFPDVPTVAESGFKDFEADLWYGVVAPAGTPKEILTQYAGWFTAAVEAPEIKAKLKVQGLYPVGACGADFAAFLKKQSDEFGQAIREANIKAQ